MTLVGINVEMVGARAKVSGAVNYIADLEFPGQVYAKALRSPYPYAKLVRIDTSKALALAGVRAVVMLSSKSSTKSCRQSLRYSKQRNPERR